MPIVQTNNLTRHYGHRVGIEDVDLAIEPGRVFGFLGPNGAGKTTTIRILLGFLRPSAGSATMFGKDCWGGGAAVRRDVGYLPGDLRLYSWLTGESAVRLVSGIRKVDLRADGTALMERFQLDPEVRVRSMSRGMRQKLGIVMTLAHRPKLLILDEPTSGLDPLMQMELADVLREMAQDGSTVVFSSHTLSEVEQICDDVAMIRRGRIVANESMEQLRQRATRDVTLVFRSPPDIDAAMPAGLRITRRDGAEWQGELSGNAESLVKWMSANDVIDVSVSAPNLESLFHRYYRDDPEVMS